MKPARWFDDRAQAVRDAEARRTLIWRRRYRSSDLAPYATGDSIGNGDGVPPSLFEVASWQYVNDDQDGAR